LVEFSDFEIFKGTGTGRLAIETEDGAPEKVAAKFKDSEFFHIEIEKMYQGMKHIPKQFSRLLHGPLRLMPHGEEVLILSDPDGHEICLVDARGLQNCSSIIAETPVKINLYIKIDNYNNNLI
jgi:hypothetical protein